MSFEGKGGLPFFGAAGLSATASRYTGAMSPSSSTSSAPPVYREEQRFRQWWVWILVVGPAALAWWPFIRQIVGGEPVGSNPAPDWLVWLIWLLIGVGLPLLFGFVALVLQVTADQVLVNYRPFKRRVIAVRDIEHVQVRIYSAVKEYGGWGIKGWSKDNVAYNVSGNRGVELTLRDGSRVMLGSQKADELAAAINGQLRRQVPVARRTE